MYSRILASAPYISSVSGTARARRRLCLEYPIVSQEMPCRSKRRCYPSTIYGPAQTKLLPEPYRLKGNTTKLGPTSITQVQWLERLRIDLPLVPLDDYQDRIHSRGVARPRERLVASNRLRSENSAFDRGFLVRSKSWRPDLPLRDLAAQLHMITQLGNRSLQPFSQIRIVGALDRRHIRWSQSVVARSGDY